ncbi:MAG: hypothetical protein COX16_08865 [Deltaproteobacteria bacterium CG23_combo_of_CG06-09_8_20_14_all_51_20]|nr:hypothetical protein [bacterium]PIP46514.1 MAG: hypothetical protein COX16_08865 [Deltaproteobacteria bacterium CG23_combo_of_CG06-09_8_20_14_all_51_20]PJB37779.1 MAG: hypothetical protein CO107_03920 [Deltaproteobacteria bacterium CG_4_9_14_3_um_filter_51_14]
MKCSKCGYTSFDYNQRCPKCNKDLTQEREWINLPPFKPNPPSLLSDLGSENTASDLDIALLKAKDAQALQREIILEDDDPQIDFSLPEIASKIEAQEEETDAIKSEKTLEELAASDAELKLVLDI